MSQHARPTVGYVLRKFPVLSETFILNELLELEAQGVPLHVFSLQPPNDPRYHEDLPRLAAHITYVPGITDIRKLLRHHQRLARQVPGPYRRTLAYVASRGRAKLLWRFVQAGFVASEARRLRLGHLHGQFANHPTTVAMLASRIGGLPFSFTAHAVDLFKSEVNPRILGRKVAEARFAATVSEYNVGFLRKVAPEANGKIVHVPNGIDLERFSPNGTPPWSPFRILCVARLVEKKGIPVLIEACRILRDRGHSFTCDIVGKGILRPQLEALIQEHRLRELVHLRGPATQGEVRERYRASHLYVLPCIVAADGNRDGLPVSLVEALACGLPVISTPVTGIPEVVRDGHNGLLVPSGDAAALAEAMARLINDLGLYRSLRAAARPSVSPRFDRHRTIAELSSRFAGVPA
jgi:glycosyltransferase involved in cell wall biosynthesis